MKRVTTIYDINISDKTRDEIYNEYNTVVLFDIWKTAVTHMSNNEVVNFVGLEPKFEELGYALPKSTEEANGILSFVTTHSGDKDVNIWEAYLSLPCTNKKIAELYKVSQSRIRAVVDRVWRNINAELVRARELCNNKRTLEKCDILILRLPRRVNVALYNANILTVEQLVQRQLKGDLVSIHGINESIEALIIQKLDEFKLTHNIKVSLDENRDEADNVQVTDNTKPQLVDDLDDFQDTEAVSMLRAMGYKTVFDVWRDSIFKEPKLAALGERIISYEMSLVFDIKYLPFNLYQFTPTIRTAIQTVICNMDEDTLEHWRQVTTSMRNKRDAEYILYRDSVMMGIRRHMKRLMTDAATKSSINICNDSISNIGLSDSTEKFIRGINVGTVGELLPVLRDEPFRFKHLHDKVDFRVREYIAREINIGRCLDEGGYNHILNVTARCNIIRQLSQNIRSDHTMQLIADYCQPQIHGNSRIATRVFTRFNISKFAVTCCMSTGEIIMDISPGKRETQSDYITVGVFEISERDGNWYEVYQNTIKTNLDKDLITTLDDAVIYNAIDSQYYLVQQTKTHQLMLCPGIVPCPLTDDVSMIPYECIPNIVAHDNTIPGIPWCLSSRSSGTARSLYIDAIYVWKNTDEDMAWLIANVLRRIDEIGTFHYLVPLVYISKCTTRPNISSDDISQDIDKLIVEIAGEFSLDPDVVEFCVLHDDYAVSLKNILDGYKLEDGVVSGLYHTNYTRVDLNHDDLFTKRIKKLKEINKLKKGQ